MFDFSSISKASKSSDSLIKRNPENNDYINLLRNSDKKNDNLNYPPISPHSQNFSAIDETKEFFDKENTVEHKTIINSKFVSKKNIIDEIYKNHDNFRSSLNDKGIRASQNNLNHIPNFNKPSTLQKSNDSEIRFKYKNINDKAPSKFMQELSNISSGRDTKTFISKITKTLAQNTESKLISRENSDPDFDKKSVQSQKLLNTEKTQNSQNSHRPLNLIKFNDSNLKKSSDKNQNKINLNSNSPFTVKVFNNSNQEYSISHKAESEIEQHVSEIGDHTRRKIQNAPKKQYLIQHMKHRTTMKDKRFNSLLAKDQRKTIVDLNPIAFQKFVLDSEKNTAFGKNMKYLKWLDLVLCCLVMGNISLSIIDNEIYLSETNKYLDDLILKDPSLASDTTRTYDLIGLRDLTVQENFFRFVNCIVVACILISIYLHYFFKVKILRADHKLSEHEGMWKSGLLKYMLMEMFFCAIVYPPYMNNVVHGVMLGQNYAYGINALICIFVTLKSYVFFRVYSYFSRWTSEAAKSICHKHNVVAGIHFAMKAELKKRPYTVLFFASFIIVVILSFAVRTFEYYVVTEITKKSTGENLQFLSNSIWMILVTMTTVGYGEFFPRSHFGRFIGVVSCVIGLLLVSLIVVSLAIISEFTNEEKKAYSFLKKINAENNMTDKARLVIKNFIKLQNMQKIKKSKLSERFIVITQLKQSITLFKNDSKIANSYDLPVDETLKLLENKLKKDINTLDSNIKKISKVDEIFNEISKEQKKCISMMEIINDRQVKLSKYMVELNNQIFKKNISQFYRRQERKKSVKSVKRPRVNSVICKTNIETNSQGYSKYIE
jgi:hypothetical protein